MTNGFSYIFGTDYIGRSYLDRLILGGINTIGLALIIVFTSSILGFFLGCYAAIRKGTIQSFIMRFSDILMSVPGILLAIVIVAIFGNGVLELFIALVIVLIPRFIRFSHSITSRINTELYITIAKVTGSSKIQILKNEILPNSKNLLMQQSILSFSEVILEISALGF